MLYKNRTKNLFRILLSFSCNAQNSFQIHSPIFLLTRASLDEYTNPACLMETKAMIEAVRWEYERKFVLIAIVIAAAVLIAIPVLAYQFKFEVDERAVVFSINGIPHCPYCYRVVEPNVGYCRQCKHRHRWVDGETKCWYCYGRKTCPHCDGTGQQLYGLDRYDCYGCFGVIYEPQPPSPSGEARPPKAKWQILGTCPHCNDSGWVIWGGSVIQLEPQRR